MLLGLCAGEAQLEALCGGLLQGTTLLLNGGAFHAPNRAGFDAIVGTYVKICMHGFSEKTCLGIVPEKTEHVYQAVQHHLATITPEQITNAINAECFKEHTLMNKMEVTVPEVPESNEKVKFIRYNPKRKKIKVAHLTDLHIDYKYTTGMC